MHKHNSQPGLGGGDSALPDRQSLFVAQLPVDGNETRPLRRILIANRGEIACRVAATCRKLKITSIAIYVEEDALSRHILDADESINLGAIDQEGGNPFLNIRALVKVALAAKADAIHPGYGYLSENAAFADAVCEAGIIFIGPSSTAMSTLGDKRSAKDYLRVNDPSIPLIPGFSGSSQDVAELEHAAEQIGFPIMLKASAGGGGKGMRIVRKSTELAAALESARSEAARSFGSGDCILEKYIESGKHIEIQILGDRYGNVVSLHERECSIQRRHQKVIEETPSPWMTPKKREEMSNTAIRIGELLRYENAGTVEFVVDAVSGDFYFLEVNTRLQVEHPITEEVTKLDIVSLQLFVAAGGDLKKLSILHDVPQVGHAIECRLCAEDPKRDFFPEHGIVRYWQQPTGTNNVRFETAVRTGTNISIYFDSMIAKIVVWAPNRSSAIDTMVRVLANTACVGVRTNQEFLQSCLLHPCLLDPMYTTSFVAQNLPDLLRNPYLDYTPELHQMLSIVPYLFVRDPKHGLGQARPFRNVRASFRNQTFDTANRNVDIVASTTAPGGQVLLCTRNVVQEFGQEQSRFLISPLSQEKPESQDDGKTDVTPSIAKLVAAKYNAISNEVRAGAARKGTSYNARLEKNDIQVVKSLNGHSWLSADVVATVNMMTMRVTIVTVNCDVWARQAMQKGEALRLMCHIPVLGTWVEFKVYSALSYCESLRQESFKDVGGSAKHAVAPMPCKILSVLKKDGGLTKAGEIVMVVESMKMEMNISIPAAGKFEAKVKAGDAVDEGTLLCVVT